MTEQETIKLFEMCHPASVDALKRLGMKLGESFEGGDRIVYRLNDTLAVKFNMWSKWQSTREIKIMECIHSDPRFAVIRKYVPPLYYGNLESGVILTRYYPQEVREYGINLDHVALVVEKIEKVKNELNSFEIAADLHFANFRLDDDGNPYVIDLGSFSLPDPIA